VFVRDLVAMDGTDNGEIVLIDELGCPTDTTILGALVKGKHQAVEAAFEAFKFPTSDVVQFKAIVSPCVTACEPIICGAGVNSLGRRRRRSASSVNGVGGSGGDEQEKMVVVRTLKIEDNFDRSRSDEDRSSSVRDRRPRIDHLDELPCFDMRPVFAVVMIFLMAQMAIIVVWLKGYNRDDKVRRQQASMACAIGASGNIPFYGQAFAMPSLSSHIGLVSNMAGVYSGSAGPSSLCQFESGQFGDISNIWPSSPKTVPATIRKAHKLDLA